MEMAGIVQVLPELCKRGAKEIAIVSDGQYLLNGMKKQGYRNRLKKNKLKNADLWKPIYDCIDRFQPKVKTTWVKGHNGHIENEICNVIAEALLRKSDG
jgi:ribonuclease HI